MFTVYGTEIMADRITSLKPIIFNDSKILILGTLPGAKSLEQQMYYADKGNYFWKFMTAYLECDFPETNEQKIDMLKRSHIALWDIFESASRVDKKKHNNTSKDTDISGGKYNDIEALLNKYPSIQKIGIAGEEAYKTFTKRYPNMNAIQLPSTSGGNCGQWGGNSIPRDREGWKSWSQFVNC